MTHDHSQHSHPRQQPMSEGSFWTSRTFLICLGFVAIAVTLLLSEHRAHFLGVLPWLFLLACPLLHFFMHGGNGRSERDGKGDPS